MLEEVLEAVKVAALCGVVEGRPAGGGVAAVDEVAELELGGAEQLEALYVARLRRDVERRLAAVVGAAQVLGGRLDRPLEVLRARRRPRQEEQQVRQMLR